MNAQRALGFGLVFLQAVVMAFCLRTPVFSAVVVAAAAVGWLSSIRFISPEKAKRLPIVLAVLYIVHRTAVPPAWYSGVRSFMLPDSILIAQYFLASQVALFFVRRDGNRLPGYLPILAMVAMIFMGDFRAYEETRLVFQVASVGLIALTAGYFAACRVSANGQSAKRRKMHSVYLAIVLLASGAVGWVSASNLYRHSHEIEMLLGDALNPRMEPESAGFSGTGRLGSVAGQKSNAGSRVALRIYANDSPGYLRGRAFDTYSRAEWKADSKRVTVLPDTIAATEDSNLHTFSLIPNAADNSHRLEIWPNQAFEEVVFAPPGLVAARMPVDSVSVDINGIIEASEMPPAAAYVALAIDRLSADDLNALQDSATTTSGYMKLAASTDWEALTSLPDDLDPRIGQLAGQIAAQSTTTGEKIAAVEAHFHTNYRYRFGIDIPQGRDPLTYFLLEKPPAHCEFFASGAAVLLRSVGVPCRYVTGFVAVERNDIGEYWVAKNRDAHAWVEAFDPELGWVIVEATPANGVPEQSTSSAASQVWDALLAKWQQLIASMRQEGLRAVVRALLYLLASPWFLLLLLAAATGYAVRRLRRRRKRRSAAPEDPRLRKLRRLLEAMDRRCRKAGLERRPGETLHQFAERMTAETETPACREAAQWYRQFAAIRYSGQVDDASLQLLEEAQPVMSGR